jgi:hypothetical protein
MIGAIGFTTILIGLVLVRLRTGNESRESRVHRVAYGDEEAISILWTFRSFV